MARGVGRASPAHGCSPAPNGFGLAVSWTWLARVLSSRNWNLCLEGIPSTERKSLVTLRPSLGVKRSKKGARVHQKGTRLNGKRDVPRSETIGRRAPRFEILAPEGPLARGPEARSQRTSGKKTPRPRAPRFWRLTRGGPRSHRAEFRAPGTFMKKIPLAIYLNGFGLAVSWTRFARVGSSRNWNLCLEGTPSTGRKSLVTVRPSLGVKRSKKGARVHQKGTRLNGKRDVPRSETIGRRALRFEILAPEGPLARGPEARSQRTSGKKTPRPRAPRFWRLTRGGPRSHRAEFRAPGTFMKKIPLAIYLNGFGLAVSWTRFARVGSSRNWNICLEGTPSTGRKSLVTVRPSLGVKRSKKGSAHPPKGYAFKWEAGRLPFGDDKS